MKSKFKIRLIHCGNTNPTSMAGNNMNIFFMPMGIFPLANTLKEQGYDVQILHTDLERNLQEVLDFSSIDVIGFDCHWINQAVAVLDTAQMIKKINPGIFIFLGGFSASLFYSQIIQNYMQIDAVIRGDGEVPIGELCNALYMAKQKADITETEFEEELGRVQNLAWRAGGLTRANSFSYVGTAKDMEKLDFAAVELLHNWQYYRHFSKFWSRFEAFDRESVFFLEIGRGCQYACTFCGGNCETQGIMNNRRGIVTRSADSVITTVRKAVEKGFNAFYAGFEYEGSDNWYLDFFDKVSGADLDIDFIYGSWKLPSERLLDGLSAGFRHVVLEISPEAGLEDQRKSCKDQRLMYSNSQLEKCLEYISSKGNIKVQLYFGYFLERDSKAAVFETLGYILKLLVKFPELLEIEYFNFSTDPGSMLYHHPEKYDIDLKIKSFEDYLYHIREHYSAGKAFVPEVQAFRPNSLSEGDVAELENKIQLFNYLFSAFRRTTSYILKNETGQPVIMEFIKENRMPLEDERTSGIKGLRKKLLEKCHEKGILDLQIIELIFAESNKNNSTVKTDRASPAIWLENDIYKGLKIDEDTRWRMEYLRNESMEGKMEKNILLEMGKFEKAREYWLGKLEGELKGITLFEGVKETFYSEKKEYEILFDEKLSSKIQGICKNQELSLYVYLLSVMKILLHIYTGQKDIIVCSPVYTISNQRYNKFILVRDSVEDEMEFKEFLLYATQTITDGYKNQFYPVEKILELLGEENNKALYQIVMAMDNIHNTDDIRHKANTNECGLCVVTGKTGRELHMNFTYDPRLYTDSLITGIGKNFTDILSKVAENPMIKIKDIHLQSDLITAKTNLIDSEDEDFEF